MISENLAIAHAIGLFRIRPFLFNDSANKLKKIGFSTFWRKKGKKIQQIYKPGSVIFFDKKSLKTVCHLSGTYVAISFERSTLRHRTSHPQASVYMILQPIRCTANCVATISVGSYPAFSPLSRSNPIGTVIFCYTTLPLRTTSR